VWNPTPSHLWVSASELTALFQCNFHRLFTSHDKNTPTFSNPAQRKTIAK
jgi:hypothetical protein